MAWGSPNENGSDDKLHDPLLVGRGEGDRLFLATTKNQSHLSLLTLGQVLLRIHQHQVGTTAPGGGVAVPIRFPMDTAIRVNHLNNEVAMSRDLQGQPS